MGIPARVVPVSGRSIGSMIKSRPANTCSCPLCSQYKTNVNCKEKHVIYSAKCYLCQEEYIGVSNRTLAKRMKEHEASVRLVNA